MPHPSILPSNSPPTQLYNYPFIHSSVHPSIHPFTIHPFTHPFIHHLSNHHPPTHPSIFSSSYPSLHPPPYSSIFSSTHCPSSVPPSVLSCTHPSIHLSIHASTYPPIHYPSSNHLFICPLYIHPSIYFVYATKLLSASCMSSMYMLESPCWVPDIVDPPLVTGLWVRWIWVSILILQFTSGMTLGGII